MDYASTYRQMHEQQPKKFQGFSIKNYVDDIAELVGRYQAKRLLDFGSGKGHQYLVRRVHERWGGVLPHCYDVGVVGLNQKPEGKFDGVICTDVMEHIEETDVDGVLAEMCDYVDLPGFLFVSICCTPAKKKLPDGRNVHLCIKPPAFWEAKLALQHRDGLLIRAEYDQVER